MENLSDDAVVRQRSCVTYMNGLAANPQLSNECANRDNLVEAKTALIWALNAQAQDTYTLIADSSYELRASELICLVVARLCAKTDRPVGYAEVMNFTYEMSSRPLAEGTIHKAFNRLLQFRLFRPAESPRLSRAGRPREMFEITNAGTLALALAVASAKHLIESRGQRAA